MQLINEQYKIVREKAHDLFGTTYIVEDIQKGNLLKYMRLINLQNGTRDFLEYMKNNFYDYSQYFYPNLMKFYFFNKIRSIDYKQVSINQYYFTYEYFEGIGIIDYCNGKDTDLRLKLTADLCSAAKYLHLRGLLLRGLSINDLQVVNDGTDSYLKVLSLPYPGKASGRIVINNEDPCFKAPEIQNDTGYTVLSDIYLIGAVIFNMFSEFKYYDEKLHINTLLSYMKEKDLMDKQVIEIVSKCTAAEPGERFQSVDEIIAKINDCFGKKYCVIEKQYIQTMPGFRIKPIARYKLIDRILNNAKEHFFADRPNKVSAVTGFEGSGMDNFLEALLFKIEQEGFIPINIVLNESEILQLRASEILAKSISLFVDKELIEKYIGGMDNSKLPDSQWSYSKESGKDSAIQRLYSFIMEASQKLHFVIIINNFQWIDKESIELIEEIIGSQNRSKLYFVFATDRESYTGNPEAREFCQKLSETNVLDTVTLKNFEFDDTAEFIRLILGMDKSPNGFSRTIYKETKGSPEYIYNLVYMLFSNNIIYVDDKGHWVFDRVDSGSLKLTNTDNIDLWNSVYKLSPNYQELLKVISVFNIPVPTYIIENFFELRKEELINQLNYLSYINILVRNQNDWGSSYSFSSQNMKKSIYDSIPSDSCIRYHAKAVNTLKNKFNRENRGNEDELISQMLKAGMDFEVKEYIMETAEGMIENKSIHQAIQFLEHANELTSKESYIDEMIMISSKLGELNGYIGEYSNAIFYYDKVESLAKAADNSYLLIDVYIKKYSLLYRSGDGKTSLKYLASAKKLLGTVDYKKGMYEHIITMNRMMLHKRKFSTYIKILENALKDIDKEKYRFYYARMLGICGKFKAYKGRQIEGLDYLLESVYILEEMGNYRKLLYPLNAIGSVYYNYYNDKQKAREYYEKCLSISQKFSDPYYLGIGHNNLAEIYRMEDKHSEALQFYQNSLKNAIIIRDKYVEYITYLNISMTNIEIEDYNKVLLTYNDMEEEFISSKYSGDLMDLFYQCRAEFYYAMGEYEKALEYAQKSVEMCISWGIAENCEAHFVKLMSEIQQSGRLDYKRDSEFLDIVFGDNLYKLGRTACVKLAEIYASKGMKEQAGELLNRGLRYAANIDTDMLRLRYEYIGSLVKGDDERLESLTRLSELIEAVENNEIKWKIYRSIAAELVERKNYREALKYLITSLSYLRKLVYNVPDEYKVRFINSHERSSIKESLTRVAELMNSNRSGHKGAMAHVIGKKFLSKQRFSLNLHEIDKYFDYTEYRDMYRHKEKDEIAASESVDTSAQVKFLGKIQELVVRFKDDEVSNLKHMINLFAEITQAKNAFIATLQEDDSLNVIASYNRYSEVPFYRYLIEQVKQKKDSIIVKDTFEYNTRNGDILIPKDITAVFCIPVMITKENDSIDLVEEKRRYRDQGSGTIIAYIYMDTDSIINNFTQESSLFCMMASKIAYVLVDNYNMKIISTVDKLTRLYTRKYFESALANELMYMEKEGGKFSIIMADIDKFKTVNDRFGHQKGDEILQNISSIIMSSVRKGDICGRYGGEEIIILLPGTDAEGACSVAEKIRKKVENSKLLGLNTTLSISLGVSSYPEHGTWAKDLIDKADQALYHVKESGRNGSRIYEVNMSKNTKRIDRLAGIISGNLVEDQRKVETMLEILELQRDKERTQEEKMFNFLGRIIEVSEAQIGGIFYVEETKEGESSISRKLLRKKLVDREVAEAYYNESILQKCMETRVGEYQIDWSGYPGIDSLTGMPDWQSVIAVPMIDRERLMGVVYLSVSIKNKEFDAGTFNYVKTLSDIMAAAF